MNRSGSNESIIQNRPARTPSFAGPARAASFQQRTMDTKTLGLNGPLPVFRLSGKVILITGGGGKIGQETARRLLREGANLVLVDIDPQALKAAVEVAKQVLSTGQSVDSRVMTIVADVTQEAEVEKYFKRCISAFGRLDCAFFNAGVDYAVKSLFDTTEEDYEKVMRLNVRSAFFNVKQAARAMRELGNGGSIVLSSSIAGMAGAPGHVLEAASKSALNGLAKTAAIELGHFGIRVNTIHPSGLEDKMKESVEDSGELEELKEAIPLGRFAQSDDVASVVTFLCSEDSKFMTGGDLKIDGGIMPFSPSVAF